ncbi:hypothetical protein [Afipia clevelandensis]|uniref:HEPN domain-containing protein n=1 Tax=Afipia clevelandensis ATCC 49720 TaxID=883079 RepID=K8PHY6_9BRAD|nr:hypothetical protein [Afipia clevelandensis]EKS40404.1 hypothetical protein HMPREF9696_00855 [Afipia clevelandensis ATCC 49720]
MNQPAKFDQDERTTPVGLFNYARSYWHSAEALSVAKVQVTHPEAPKSFLFYHAIELYLKAYLRGIGKTVSDLIKVRHNVISLSSMAKEQGLQIAYDIDEVLRLMDSDDNVMRSRYISTGLYNAASEDALSEACKYLDAQVGVELSKRNFPIRLSEPMRSEAAQVDELGNIESDLDSLSRKEREIVGYLLHHNLRLFTADADGGYANTLIARGIIRVALRHGQVYSPSDVPMEVPRPIWTLLKRHREHFPYVCSDHDPDPWRVGFFERL